jgi:HAD superfamily hydrolase (TIGR01509 family)
LPNEPVRAVIFDLDGTLIDSEPNQYLADRQVLAKYGIAFSEQDKRRYIGGSNLEQMVDLARRHGLPVGPETLVTEKIACYLEIAERSTRVYPNMKRFLDLLVAHRVPVAVASGSPLEVIHRLLPAVGLAPYFELVVSADEVGRGKPAPDVFLEAARRLGVPPRACVVAEDSCPGVEAAHSASMRCIAVPYLTEKPLPEAFGLADLLFPEGMDTFNPEAAWAWVQARLEPGPSFTGEKMPDNLNDAQYRYQ